MVDFPSEYDFLKSIYSLLVLYLCFQSIILRMKSELCYCASLRQGLNRIHCMNMNASTTALYCTKSEYNNTVCIHLFNIFEYHWNTEYISYTPMQCSQCVKLMQVLYPTLRVKVLISCIRYIESIIVLSHQSIYNYITPSKQCL